MAPTLASPAARYLRGSLLASMLLHVALAALLVVDFLWPFLMLARPLPNPDLVVLQARTGSSVGVDELDEAAVIESKSENTLKPAEVDRPVDDVFGNRTADAVSIAAEEALQKDPEANRGELEQLAGKLGRISSEKSVDEMAGKLRQWLGTSTRAERPSEKAVAGEFDFATAQLHDVRREPNAPTGGYAYFAILVDAAGRRYESPMDEIEGESAYKTMQLVKANPLAEMVYRRIVMGFLDNVIKAGKAAQEGAEAQESARAAKPPAQVAPE